VEKPRTKGRLGSVIGEKWRIEKALGSGGMASVYSAVNLNNGFRVAVKILSDQCSKEEETRKRFLREGYFANKVDHEGIANVMDDGVTEDGALYLIMELLEGKTLEERRVASSGTIPFDDSIDIILAVADVLAAAHDAGLVHRDVKPQNVFITNHARIKLLDFGVAGKRQVNDESTRTGAGYGTPMYMAPEQMTGEERIDARVDVFALASTMYRILSGKFPFEASSLADYLVATLRTKPARLDTLVREVSPALAEVVARALASEPDQRYPDARAFAAAINKALQPERQAYTEETVALATLKMNHEDFDTTTVLHDPQGHGRHALASGVAPPPPPARSSSPSVPPRAPSSSPSVPPAPRAPSSSPSVPPPRAASSSPSVPPAPRAPSGLELGPAPARGVHRSTPPSAATATPTRWPGPLARFLQDPHARSYVAFVALGLALATTILVLAWALR